MRRQRAKKKNLTLIEIMIALIIVGVITTLAIPGYNNLLANAETNVCEANLEVLDAAVTEAYLLENDKLPGALGQLKDEHLKKGWAKVLKENGGWKLKLAYFIVDFKQRGLAYAQGAWVARYVGSTKYLICPADSTPYPGGHSYGINTAVAGISAAAYKALPDNTIIICDSDTATFTAGSEAMRHKKHKILSTTTDNYALGVNKAKKHGCKGRGCPGGFSNAAGGYQGQGWMMRNRRAGNN